MYDDNLNKKLLNICYNQESCQSCPLYKIWNCDGTDKPDNYHLLFKEANKVVENNNNSDKKK